MEAKEDYNTYSDEQLTDLLRVSDQGAFTEIFSRFGSLLFSITQRRLNDKELSKDLIQEVFADLWEKRLTLHVPGNLQSFLITVIKNRILNHYKHQKVTQKYIDQFQQFLNTAENKTDYLLRHNNFSALIEQEVAALPEKMQAVFELSRKEHMNRKEIANTLGIPQETVNSRMRHALKILRSKLASIATVALFLHL